MKLMDSKSIQEVKLTIILQKFQKYYTQVKLFLGKLIFFCVEKVVLKQPFIVSGNNLA